MGLWYRTGTISVTNGSSAVVGTGTAWVQNVEPGDAFHAPDGKIYEIVTVSSDTTMTISPAYLGGTASAQGYAIQPTEGWQQRLLAQIEQLLGDTEEMVDGPGQGKFDSQVVFQGDEDTGMTNPDQNILALIAAGVEQLRLTNGQASGAAVQSSVTDTAQNKKLVTVEGAAGATLSRFGTYYGSSDNFDIDTAPPGFCGLVHTNNPGTWPPSAGTSFCWIETQALYNGQAVVQRALMGYSSDSVPTDRPRLFQRIRNNSGTAWGGWAEVLVSDGDKWVLGRGGVTSGARLEVMGGDETAGDLLLDPGGAASLDQMGFLVDETGNNRSRLHIGRKFTGDAAFEKQVTLDGFLGFTGFGDVSPRSRVEIFDGDLELGTSGDRFAEYRILRRDTGATHGMAAIGLKGAGANGYMGEIAFYTGNQNDSYSLPMNERMRLDSYGDLRVRGGRSFVVDAISEGSAGFTASGTGGGAAVHASSGADTDTFVDFDAKDISGAGGKVTYRFGRETIEGGTSMLILYDHTGQNSPAFKVTSAGLVTADGSFTGGGADYAEYFEWLDGNTQGEDRRGLSVVLEGAKIRPALDGEVPIGVVSVNPSVVGDGDIDRWKEKYLKDEFGAEILEDVEWVTWTETVTETETVQEQVTEAREVTREVIEVEEGKAVRKTVTETVQVPLFDEFPLVDEEGNPVISQIQVGEDAEGAPIFEDRPAIHRAPRLMETQKEITRTVKHRYASDAVPEGIMVPEHADRVYHKQRKINPAYDPSRPYTPRAERPEWDMVGLVGKLRIRKGQPVAPNWIKMRDVSDEVEEWLLAR